VTDVSHGDASNCTSVYFLVTKAPTYALATRDSEKKEVLLQGERGAIHMLPEATWVWWGLNLLLILAFMKNKIMSEN